MPARETNCETETQGFGTLLSSHVAGAAFNRACLHTWGEPFPGACPGCHPIPWARSAGVVMYRDVPCVRDCHRPTAECRQPVARASPSHSSHRVRESPGALEPWSPGGSGQDSVHQQRDQATKVGLEQGCPTRAATSRKISNHRLHFCQVSPLLRSSVPFLASTPCLQVSLPCLPYLPYRESGTVLSARCPSSARPLFSPPSTNKILTNSWAVCVAQFSLPTPSKATTIPPSSE